MKTLRHLCAALALTFVLAFPAFAGQMDAGISTPPPPPPLAGQMDTGIAAPPPPPQGNMSTTVTGNVEADATDTATEIALNLLQSLLSLL